MKIVQRKIAKFFNAQISISFAMIRETKKTTKKLKKWRIAHDMIVTTQNVFQTIMRRKHKTITFVQQTIDQTKKKIENLKTNNVNFARMHDRELNDNEFLRRTVIEIQSNNVTFRASNAALLREVEKLRAELAISQRFVFHSIMINNFV